MHQKTHRFSVATRGKGLTDITAQITRFVGEAGVQEGLVTVWCRHTSASLTVQENASPAVRRDIARFFENLVPEDTAYEHDDEGADDMPAHLRTMLTHTSLSIPVADGQLALGTWQAVYLFEHRRSPHRREIALHIIGE